MERAKPVHLRGEAAPYMGDLAAHPLLGDHCRPEGPERPPKTLGGPPWFPPSLRVSMLVRSFASNESKINSCVF